MRAPVRLCALLGLTLSLLAPCAAQADITPIPKPPESTGAPAVSDPAVVVVPLPKPQVETPAEQVPARQTPTAPSTTAGTSAPAETTSPTRKSEPQPAISEGGRELPVAPEPSDGGREGTAPRLAVLATLIPTPLGLVGLHESLPEYQAYPTWLLGLFTLLASAEAFLLTHVVRARRAAVVEADDLDDLNRL